MNLEVREDTVFETVAVPLCHPGKIICIYLNNNSFIGFLIEKIMVENTGGKKVGSKPNNKERHIRWNWEPSPDNTYDGHPMVRYHFVIVGDRFIQSTYTQLIDQLQKWTGGIEEIRTEKGKVKGTKLQYLLKSVDAVMKPSNIDWTKINLRARRDSDLVERVVGTEGIANYVGRIYHPETK